LPWPTGQRAIEAGAKKFNKCVKGSAQFGNRPEAEAILTLTRMVMDQDDRWDRYWAIRSAYGFV
jgi:hypothetical protein